VQAAEHGHDITGELERLMSEHKGTLCPPVVCDIPMPKNLWWLTLVAAECAGANPAWVASVMRFEHDFKVGPTQGRKHVPPMGIHYDFSRKYPIYHLFGNILVAARRLGQFEVLSKALRGYNKNRSHKFTLYCRAVTKGVREVNKSHVKPVDDVAWRSAVELGRVYLLNLEAQAATCSRRRN